MSGRTRTPDGSRAVTELSVGDVVADKYQIESVIGVGGMGVVFLARHLELDAPVALKFLSVEYMGNAEAIRRFRLEAQAAVKLRNDHVVRVFDVGMHTSGLPYMVMEYLEGLDLEKLIRTSGPLAPALAAELLVQTCEALTDAHGKGIVHRDLKPSNLFCIARTDGRLTIKVVDFGISKVIGALSISDQGLTGTGSVIGSPSYMSPEQMKTPNRIDHRTDIWSLGVVLYESLTGALPFPASTYAEICLRVHQDPPVPVSSHGRDIPRALETVIARCLAKDVEQRYGSTAELAGALLPFVPTAARGTPAPILAIDGVVATSRRSPADPSPRLETLTFGQPNWTRTKHALNVRMRHPRAALLAALVLAAGVAWVWGLDTKPASTNLVARQRAEPPSASAATAETEARPPWVDDVAAGTTSVATLAGPSASAATPSTPDRQSAPLIDQVSPTATLRAAVPSGGKAVATTANAPGASPRPAISPSARGARPRTERDPRSSTWTR